MERYFTFFLYSRERPGSEKILRFVDWLVQTVPHDGPLHVIARETQARAGTKFSVQGDFKEYRDKLGKLSLAMFNVSSLHRTRAGTEVFFRFEKTGREAQEASGIQGQALAAGSKTSNAFTTITFSLRSDIWMAGEQTGLSAHLLAATEELFVAHDCLYGYGHETPFVIAGRFSLIGGNAKAGVPRIVDFDYSRYIEDVYQYNYISESLLRSGDDSNIRTLGNGIECKALKDASGMQKGLGVYLTAYSSRSVERVRECLGPVVWSG
jgi:hypothetical protein